MFKANLSTKLTSAGSGFNQQITAGTFVIGDATFEIGENTTLSSLISQINESESAQATAYWDDTTGKLTITSKREGASYINIEAGTSNFTDVMGLTETTRDGEGNIINSRMYTDTQQLGLNALFTINGTNITSTSNTVTEDVSRIAGVTLTLKKVTTEEDAKATLQVSQDNGGLVDAVKSFVDAYNETISKIDTVTASGADLQRESSLISLKNSIRNYAMSSNTINGGEFKTLSQIGISTSSADGSNLSTDTSTLKFDEKAF
ncbi:MAG: flagellar filament capping protein FliD, partial [Spirochaetales bacterium]|nr:flagellar filament capping protein FliD [Spirochaetales bacterium]